MPRLLAGRAAISHLLRRAGFGPSPEDREGLLRLDYEEALHLLLRGLDEAPSAPIPR